MNQGTCNVYHASFSHGAIGAVGPHSTVINNSHRGNCNHRGRMFHTSRCRAERVTGYDQPLAEIPYKVEREIVEMLDPSNPFGNDFRGLAGFCGRTNSQINFLAENGKSRILLQQLCEQRKTVGYLVDQLKKIKREDIIQVIGMNEDIPTSSGEVEGLEEWMSNHVSPTEGDDCEMDRKRPPPPTEEIGDSNEKYPPPPTEEASDSNEKHPQPPTEEAGDSNEKRSPPPTEEAGDSNGKHSPPPTEEAPKQPLQKGSAGAKQTESFTRKPREISLESNTETGSRTRMAHTNTSQDSMSSSACTSTTYMARYSTENITANTMSLKLIDSDSDYEDGPRF